MTTEEFIKSISLECEVWKEFAGYEEIYMVSSCGRVLSKLRTVRNRSSIKTVQPRLLNPHISRRNRNYCVSELKLWKGSVGKTFTLHKMVATMFIPNPNGYKEIDHIDGNPQNNNISNLKWCTHSQNVNNPITRKRNSLAKTGIVNTKKSVPVVQLLDGRLIETFPSISEAERNGFQHSKICLCCSHKREKHKGYQWMYLSDYKNLVNKSKNIEPTNEAD